MVEIARNAPSLFKYLKRDHAEALLAIGQLRVGTLYDFQNEEQHGSEIGDAEEGLRTVYSDEDFDIEHVPAFAKETLIANPHGHKHVQFKGIEFRLTRTSPNLYVYSTCQAFEHPLLSEFNCDACVEIVDVHGFFTAVTAQLKSGGIASELLYLGPCHYRSRREHHSAETDLHPSIVKAGKHSYQKEVRALWRPSDGDVRPRLLIVPEVRQAVRLVHPG